jgi:hypothetical protein
MPGGPKPRDADAELASSRLTEALDSCRSVVSDYRAMLAGRGVAENIPQNTIEFETPRDAA